ncbi:MAG: ABC transporter ATP-binding protein [Chloroflexi bacterium]|nr:ABC transporter ATP-binding protein [Chloroflexota bacterium]
MSEKLVETERLDKLFVMGGETIKAVDNVDLVIGGGEFLSIMGPSGSGKTTLLNLIGCLDRPDGGRILFEGQDVVRLREGELDQLRLRKIGFVFQTFNLLPTLTALENVTLPMIVARASPSGREKRAREILSWVGLSHRLAHYPRQLSAGENQRVAIARALANQPRLILADEPTGNLDSKSKEEIAHLLQRVNSEHGTAMLLVTHDPIIAGIATKTFRMVDGKISDG